MYHHSQLGTTTVLHKYAVCVHRGWITYPGGKVSCTPSKGGSQDFIRIYYVEYTLTSISLLPAGTFPCDLAPFLNGAWL